MQCKGFFQQEKKYEQHPDMLKSNMLTWPLVKMGFTPML